MGLFRLITSTASGINDRFNAGEKPTV